MELLQLLAFNFALVAGLMLVMWLLSLARRDSSIVDPFWGFGFVVIAWSTWWMTEAVTARGLVLLGLGTVWGLRLTTYLLSRNWGEEEDRRYAAMREHHGPKYWWVSLYLVFGLQGLIMWLVSLPIQAGMLSTAPLWWLDYLGIAVWSIGFFFESVGDYQMSRFKADPENSGKVMNQGLWRYTRHPNYFGDFCIWWGHYLLAAAGGAWWTIISPSIMSFFLLKVSGVAMLEKDIADRRPKYREYTQRTNAFFPGPRRAASVD